MQPSKASQPGKTSMPSSLPLDSARGGPSVRPSQVDLDDAAAAAAHSSSAYWLPDDLHATLCESMQLGRRQCPERRGGGPTTTSLPQTFALLAASARSACSSSLRTLDEKDSHTAHAGIILQGLEPYRNRWERDCWVRYTYSSLERNDRRQESGSTVSSGCREV